MAKYKIKESLNKYDPESGDPEVIAVDVPDVSDSQEESLSDELSAPLFDFFLIVKNPFMGHAKGDMIFKDSDIQLVIDTGNLPNCIKRKRG